MRLRSLLLTVPLILLLGALGKAPAHAAEVAKTELYVIQTTTLTEKQFLTGTRDGKPASIAAELRLPPSTEERLPAVILLHGSGGIIPIEEHWSRVLNDMGIATFQLDVLTGRGIGNTLADQSQLSPLNGINDAFRALELLSSHPRIDPKRIGILGGSRGATGALFTSLRRFERLYAAPGTQFAVHLVFYANCGTTFIDGDDVANRPIRLFHGTADDVTPVEACRSYIARLQRAGKDVRLMQFSGAHHGFDNVDGKVRRLEQAQVPGHCILEETTVGVLVERQSSRAFSYDLPCVRRGATVGYDASAHEQALKEVKATLQQVFKLPAPTAERGAPAETEARASFLVAHVRVFDGERVHENTRVAVEAGIIRAIGPDLTQWRHLPVIDGTGATLIPGLIDAHVHVRTIDDLRDALRFGVTTVLAMGAVGVTPQTLSTLRSTAASRMDVADFRSAGFIAAAPGGHGTEFRDENVRDIPTVATVEMADAFVAARHDEGSDYLKIALNGVRTADQGIPNLDAPRVKALVDAAHSRGMLAVAHVETIEDVETALAGGIDGLAHVWRRGGFNLDLARRLAAKHVFVAPVLSVPNGLLPDTRAALLADARLQPFLSNRLKAHLSRPWAPRTAGSGNAERQAHFDAHVAAVRSLHEAGVTLLVGTDSSIPISNVGGTPSAPGVSPHRELELLTSAGLSSIEALSAATVNTANAFRLADRGRIVAGRKADLVLVRGNPIADITATRDILRVWRSGVELDRRLAQ